MTDAREEVVEIMARARYESDREGALPDDWEPWAECDRTTQAMYRGDSRTALAALDAAGYTVARLERVGEWTEAHGLVNIGDPWAWDYNDDHFRGAPSQAVYRVSDERSTDGTC